MCGYHKYKKYLMYDFYTVFVLDEFIFYGFVGLYR